MCNQVTPLQQSERDALTGSGSLAIIRVISALRSYRAAVATLSSKNYVDGECDAVALSIFFSTIDDIEHDYGP